MKVVYFNNQLGGGAARAAQRIFHSVRKQGVKADFVYAHGQASSNPHYVKWTYPRHTGLGKYTAKLKAKAYYRYINKYYAGRPNHLEHFSYAGYHENTPLPELMADADIIHLHQIDNFLDYPSFFQSVPAKIPIIWSLHDMEPFTGGCHYSWTCEGYKSSCISCPQLGDHNNRSLAAKNLKLKAEVLKDRNIHVVANCEWTWREAMNSSLFKLAKKIHKVHYGIELDQFTPLDKEACRKALNIPDDMFCISFGSADIANRRKGFVEMLSVLKVLAEERLNIMCLIFGHGGELMEEIDIPCIQLGYIQSPELQSLVYSASDLFVMPTLYDALPQTVLESIACGTPVIGFHTGGLPDMIIPGKSGYLIDGIHPDKMAAAIISCYHNPEIVHTMSEEARTFAEKSFSMEKCGREYLGVYQEALNKKTLSLSASL
ncbi:MAG: glycosyltransferase [Bacteroidota bacterium]